MIGEKRGGEGRKENLRRKKDKETGKSETGEKQGREERKEK
jgi:hypothetical protein